VESAGGSREVHPEVSEHGLKEDAIGFRDALIIGMASTAPAYSLAAVIGLVVVTVGVQAPAVLLASFVPMFFVATAFYYMNRADQDCGTTFSWVTPYREDERWPCGEFVNQSERDTGLTRWTQQNRSIENTDVVLWYVFGIHHITRPEEWPVMPVDTVSFWLKPAGFFDRNPALDVPPTSNGHCHPSQESQA
jgi:hypothetical protein